MCCTSLCQDNMSVPCLWFLYVFTEARAPIWVSVTPQTFQISFNISYVWLNNHINCVFVEAWRVAIYIGTPVIVIIVVSYWILLLAYGLLLDLITLTGCPRLDSGHIMFFLFDLRLHPAMQPANQSAMCEENVSESHTLGISCLTW